MAVETVREDDIWTVLPDGQQQVTLTRDQYEVMRVAANARVRDVGRQNRSRAAAASRKPGGSKPAASQPAPAASEGVVVDDSGRLLYRGYTVQLGGGEPHVFTTSGWMKVSAFEAAGLSTDDLATAAFLAGMGGTYASQRFRQGPGGS